MFCEISARRFFVKPPVLPEGPGPAHRSKPPSRPSPPTGHPTISRSMTGISFRTPIGGAFIAFHGSWNRAPFAQGAYNVVSQPLATARHRVISSCSPMALQERSRSRPGRAPAFGTCSRARWRALHLGRLPWPHLARDLRGRDRDDRHRTRARPAHRLRSRLARCRTARGYPSECRRGSADPVVIAEPSRRDRGGGRSRRPGVSRPDGGGTCEGCHGSNAQGTPLAADLTSGKWLWGDGSLTSIVHTINDGVPNPKDYRSPMPPKGGAQLSNADVKAVAAYVRAPGHQTAH